MLGPSLLTDVDVVLFMDIDALFYADAIDCLGQFVIKGDQVCFTFSLSTSVCFVHFVQS